MNLLKKTFVLFLVQTFLYGLLCINIRAVSQVDYVTAVASDFAIASMTYLVIRHIATDGGTLSSWIGYVLGSVCGTVAGIWLSSMLTKPIT
jgi:hypothetical protein